MRINTKFSVAVHTLILVADVPDDCSSSFIAGSVNTNPVVIRKIIGLLQKAGILKKNSRRTGYDLLKSPAKITMLDIYRAVAANESESLFNVHENSNIQCNIGASIQFILEDVIDDAQKAMEKVLSEVNLQQLIKKIPKN
jgi:Rrf2 family protein